MLFIPYIPCSLQKISTLGIFYFQHPSVEYRKKTEERAPEGKMASASKAPTLPIQQLAILSLCRLPDPISLTSIFPYLPEMIESFGVPKHEVGRWAGITSAIFSLSQAVTSIFWGKASDRFGRKPVLLAGMICLMSSGLLLGFSQNLAMAIVARLCAGASHGNTGVLKTFVAELVPRKELQPRAFTIMPLVWAIGSIFGPSFVLYPGSLWYAS